MYALIDHVFSWPTGWQFFELILLLGFALHSHYLNIEKGWFKEPVKAPVMIVEMLIVGALSAFLDTDFQLEGMFVFFAYHYVKEILKHDHVLRNLIIVGFMVVVLVVVIV